MRIGHGYDVHRLVENRKLIIGGEGIIRRKLWALADDRAVDVPNLITLFSDKLNYMTEHFNAVRTAPLLVSVGKMLSDIS